MLVTRNGVEEWYEGEVFCRRFPDGVLHFIHNEHVMCIIDEYAVVSWLRDGLLHYENGPAIEYTDGSKAYYINDNRVEEFCDEHTIPYTYKDWPLEYKILWKLNAA